VDSRDGLVDLAVQALATERQDSAGENQQEPWFLACAGTAISDRIPEVIAGVSPERREWDQSPDEHRCDLADPGLDRYRAETEADLSCLATRSGAASPSAAADSALRDPIG
jgi:hypothetical protein